MKERFMRFMQGRYGSDEFSRFLIGAMVVVWILSLVFGRLGRHILPMFVLSNVFNYIALAIIIYCWFRMFSRNIQ